jgi:hypothetical protein
MRSWEDIYCEKPSDQRWRKKLAITDSERDKPEEVGKREMDSSQLMIDHGKLVRDPTSRPEYMI